MLAKKILVFAMIFMTASMPVLAQNAVPELSCRSALLLDYSTGTVLYENNPHEKLPMASVTKIMTMLLAMEAIDSGKLKYTDIITGSAYAKSMGGSTIFLDEGERMSAEDILKGIAVASGNDAAVAMAEHLGGSSEAFVEMMNTRARELGMNDTHFVNCNGLDADGHYSTAYDIALMSRELMKHPDIHRFTTIWMDSLRGGKFTLSNTNKLVRFYDGATGLKTGSTDKALFCISATAERNNMHLIAVIMAAPTSKQRQADASKLLNYGFANYRLKTVAEKGSTVREIKTDKGVKSTCRLICEGDIYALTENGKENDYKLKYKLKKEAKAPIKKGDRAGELICMSGKKEIGRTALLYGESIDKMSVLYAYGKIVDIWMGGK